MLALKQMALQQEAPKNKNNIIFANIA